MELHWEGSAPAACAADLLLSDKDLLEYLNSTKSLLYTATPNKHTNMRITRTFGIAFQLQSVFDIYVITFMYISLSGIV